MSDIRPDKYFAYGSNMLFERLQQRLASAHSLGHAQLNEYSWRCNKLGRDGTAKANLARQPGACVHGVLYQITADAWPHLDRFEPDYRRITVQVTCQGQVETAFTYISELLTDRPASKAYLDYIIRGAEAHALPPAYIRQIAALSFDS